MDDLETGPDGTTDADADAATVGSDLSWCVACQSEYLSSIQDCPVCEAPLQAGRPTSIEEVAPEAEDKLAYEFHEWSVESRVMMESLLVSAGVVHAWQGTTLMVREEDEAAVDVVVDEVEHAILPTLDPEADLVAFESGDWSAEQQGTVIGALVAQEIAHGFDADGDLVIEEANQETVSGIITDVLAGVLMLPGPDEGFAESELQSPEASDPQDEEVYVFGEERLQGLEAQELLGELFVASNRMAKNPRHPKSVETVLSRADRVEAAALPFGFERPVWREIVDGAVVIRDQIIDNDVDEEELMESAAELCKVLRPYV